MFKKICFTAFIIIGLLIIGFATIYGDEYTINIEQSVVQEQVNKQLPKLIKKKGVATLVKDADVLFLEDNRVQIKVDFEADGYGMDALGQAEFKSGIRYENGDFFLSDLELVDLSIKPSERAKETQSKAKKSLEGAWNKLKLKVAEKSDTETHKALDHLKGKALEKAIPKLKAFTERKVRETIERTPIYSLNGKDFKQSLTALALKDVRFVKESMSVTLSVF